MTAFETVLTDIFDRRADHGKLPLDEERAAILAARAGDDEALTRLMYAYAYTLRTAVVWFTRALPEATPEQVEDVRSHAVMGFVQAIHKVDLGLVDRLASLAPKYVQEEVSKAASEVAKFTVPERTLKRFFGILREARGNISDAVILAPTREMKPETFLAVLSAVRNVESYDAYESGDDEGGESDGLENLLAHSIVFSPSAINDAEDRILVEAAFRSVDTLEEDVCRLVYGFADYDPVSDEEAGSRLSPPMSRAKTQRTRTAALGKMRNALGVA